MRRPLNLTTRDPISPAFAHAGFSDSLPSGINNSQRYGRCQLITGAIANDADMAEQYRQRYFAIPACAVLNLQRDADLALGYDGTCTPAASVLVAKRPLPVCMTNVSKPRSAFLRFVSPSSPSKAASRCSTGHSGAM